LQWVERQALRAHIDHIDAKRSGEIGTTIIRFEVEDRDRQIAAAGGIDK
jgi:hypothetical protein